MISDIIIFIILLIILHFFYISYKKNYDFFQNVETIEDKL